MTPPRRHRRTGLARTVHVEEHDERAAGARSTVLLRSTAPRRTYVARTHAASSSCEPDPALRLGADGRGRRRCTVPSAATSRSVDRRGRGRRLGQGSAPRGQPRRCRRGCGSSGSPRSLPSARTSLGTSVPSARQRSAGATAARQRAVRRPAPGRPERSPRTIATHSTSSTATTATSRERPCRAGCLVAVAGGGSGAGRVPRARCLGPTAASGSGAAVDAGPAVRAGRLRSAGAARRHGARARPHGRLLACAPPVGTAVTTARFW